MDKLQHFVHGSEDWKLRRKMHKGPDSLVFLLDNHEFGGEDLFKVTLIDSKTIM